jgi:hypothetical protein
MTSELTELARPRSWAARGIDGPLRARFRGTVEPVNGERSRVTIELLRRQRVQDPGHAHRIAILEGVGGRGGLPLAPHVVPQEARLGGSGPRSACDSVEPAPGGIPHPAFLAIGGHTPHIERDPGL